MTKRPLTPSELQAHLDEQIGFLERSADAFDAGYEGEAKRLAVTLRVLLHDTQKSHSLLQQLNQKKRDFVDTALDFDPANLATHGGLVFVALGPPRTRFVAMLDDVPMLKKTNFDAWWTGPVFVDKDRRTIARKDLVLIAANQDGGAHVDPALDESYDKLSRENSLNLTAVEDGIRRPMEGPERAAIRQIAHEALKTLKAGYHKKPAHEASLFVGGMSLVQGGPPSGSVRKLAPTPKGRRGKVGRNEPCPCGSGKKYKHCCGRLVA